VSWTAWDPAPLVLVPATVALMLFGRAFVRLRRRGRADHASGGRAVLFLFALAAGVLPLVSPLDAAAASSLSAHMLQHVLIGDAAPALGLLALRGPLLFFLLPGDVLRPLARSRLPRGVLGFLLRPRVSLVAWAVDLAAWHVPAVYDYALSHQAAHDLEHVSFLVGGLLVWSQLLDPARRGTLRPAERLGFATAMFGFAAALAGTLLLTGPLYPAYAGAAGHLFGASAASDQQLAGLVMLGEQAVALALCAGLLLPAIRGVGGARGQRRRTTAALGAGAFVTASAGKGRTTAPLARQSDALGIR
jgi:putative membrane protein